MENRYKDSPGITEETKRLLREQFRKDAEEEVSFNQLMDTVFIEAQSADEVAEALTGLCEQDLVAVWSSIGEQAYEDDRPPVSYLEKICRSNPASAAWNIAHEHYSPQPPDFPITRREPGHLKSVWLCLNRF